MILDLWWFSCHTYKIAKIKIVKIFLGLSLAAHNPISRPILAIQHFLLEHICTVIVNVKIQVIYQKVNENKGFYYVFGKNRHDYTLQIPTLS